MALTAEPIPLPVGARDRLMARVHAASTSPVLPLGKAEGFSPRTPLDGFTPRTHEDFSPPPQRSLPWLTRALLAACIGALFGGLAVWLPLREQAHLPGATEVHLIALKGGETQPLARGRIFWDLARHKWHTFVFDLKPPPSGKTYQLWFITSDQKKVSAGALRVDARGSGSLVVPQREDIGPIVAAAVTLEPLGGSDQPTGIIQLAGALN
ncbi:MAG: anti-sigma factor [Tepidisphaeraceae bacterium]